MNFSLTFYFYLFFCIEKCGKKALGIFVSCVEKPIVNCGRKIDNYENFKLFFSIKEKENVSCAQWLPYVTTRPCKQADLLSVPNGQWSMFFCA